MLPMPPLSKKNRYSNSRNQSHELSEEIVSPLKYWRHFWRHKIQNISIKRPRSFDMGKRKNRRDVERDPKSKTFRETRLKWSEWHEAMVPHDIGEKNTKLHSLRTAPHGFRTKHYYTKNTRKRLSKRCPKEENCWGIYELKIEKGSKAAVVYVGLTHRKAGWSMYRRISEYMKDGSHIKVIIQRALDKKFKVYVRQMKLSPEDCLRRNGKKLAEQFENKFLGRYNYAKYERSNG